jgi:hypothetical protein
VSADLLCMMRWDSRADENSESKRLPFCLLQTTLLRDCSIDMDPIFGHTISSGGSKIRGRTSFTGLLYSSLGLGIFHSPIAGLIMARVRK